MSTMAERIKQDDPGFRRLKITRASSGSFGHSAVEEDVRALTAEEEQDMILGGLDAMVAGAGSTGFGTFVKKAVNANHPENHGYVDDNGMPHSKPAEGATGFAAFQQRQAAGGREDHNYTDQQKVTQPTTGFGAGEGLDTNMEEDRRDTLDDGGTMSTAELMEKIQELLPKEERFRIPPEKKDQPPEEETRTADDSTPDGTQWQSETVDATSPRDRDLPDIPEDLPGKYVPEKGDGSHPLPNDSFEDWGTPPVPGVSQEFPQDPAKLTNIMGSLTRIRLSDGRVLIGKIVAENQMKLKFFGRVAGDRADSSFDLWKRDIVGPREAVRVKRSEIRQAREIMNLDNAYELYNRTREAKDPKKDYVVEKAIVSPADGVDRSVEKATNTRGARTMKKTSSNGIYEQLQAAGCEMDSHESDLYVKVTPESTAIVDSYQFKSNVTTFTSQIDGERWYDIPFAYVPFWENKTASEIIHEASRRKAADLGICQECGKAPAIATFVAENGDDVNYCDACADYLGAEIKPGFVASRRTANSKFKEGDRVRYTTIGPDESDTEVEGTVDEIYENGDTVIRLDDGSIDQGVEISRLEKIGSTGRRAAEEGKEKTVTPKTGPKDNVATNDTMNDESFYGDDKALHDQLDKHEKRASILKREAMVKLKMADNYEKAGNIKMAKEMDKEGAALYTEWRQVMATIAGIKKEAEHQRKITASARPTKMFFENSAVEDKDNPFV